ncbi:hypothetical protein [Paracoccus sp. (in: a-proteobacteria)]|uniref:hypothetical protein n=1 Tax=Paracoccus sp. TaxID=267 RepID=UPI003A8B49B9
MIRPQIRVTVDGVPVSGTFFDRLVSLTVTDREGIRSDTLDLVFSDAVPHVRSPRRGAIVAVTILNGTGTGFVGAYVIDRIEIACLPSTISVRGAFGRPAVRDEDQQEPVLGRRIGRAHRRGKGPRPWPEIQTFRFRVGARL